MDELMSMYDYRSRKEKVLSSCTLQSRDIENNLGNIRGVSVSAIAQRACSFSEYMIRISNMSCNVMLLVWHW